MPASDITGGIISGYTAVFERQTFTRDTACYFPLAVPVGFDYLGAGRAESGETAGSYPGHPA